MTNTKMTLVDWLDDLCVRFIVNLPNEELQSVERICFQIEEAQWFYEDFIRPLDPNSLPSMHLRKFSQLMFQHCPLFSAYSEELHQQAYEQFLAYKTRVPVRGAIMLNHDMTHAVLVKGWKKGAKWSFPRGKINKEETDLDCAVREVYEETGFDLTETDLVLPEEDMKKITVTMREQSMMLYVFRGVPMDTHFEPRTRKEISKIDWYKLTDLPTLRRKNQAQQQGTGQDLIKESSFYMVAPFLGPLKSWIKQQHKLDRQRLRNSAHLAPPIAAAITDDEDMQAELYETATDHNISHQNDTVDVNFANIIAKLGRTHRPSDALPELSEQPQAQHSIDPAAELKRLLSVGTGVQSPAEVPGQQPQANALLALFQQDTTKPSAPAHVSVPHTPFDQNMPTPMQPTSPHGQHQPRPFQPDNMPAPPPFPFPPQHGLPFHGHHSSLLNQSPHNNLPQHLFPLHQHQTEPAFPAIHSPVRQMSGQPPEPPFHPTRANFGSDSQFAQSTDSQAFGARGSGPPIPPASKLPPPKMNAHTLGLLNAFRVGSQQQQQQQQQHVPLTTLDNSVDIQDSPSTQHARLHGPANQRHHPNELSSPQFQSPPINIQPAQPKPRSAHQDSLLTLFRATPPISSPEPAELSALPTTPGYSAVQPSAKPVEVPANAPHSLHGVQHKSIGITSATVRAPVNAPDFETVKKHTQQNVSGSSRGPSPAAFAPQQLLRREQPLMVQSPSGITASNAPSQDASKASSPLHPDFKPQVLKRPNLHPATISSNPPTAHSMSLLEMFKSPSPQPSSGQPQLPSTRSPVSSTLPKGPEQQESLPSDQKNTLLALFGKPSPKPEGSAVTASPKSTSRSPLPPTPKTTMSGVVSPVSPLPDKGSHTASPADATARSRISSIGDGGPPGSIPPTSHPAASGESAHPYNGGFSGQARNRSDGKSPVDKTFLLGFLEDVARRGR